MVKVGDIYWTAEVRGADEAQDAAGGLRDSFDDVAGSFLGTAAAEETATEATKENTEATRENERWTERLNADTGLLSSALTFLSSRFGVVSAAATVYGTATAYAAGATTLLNGAIATTYGLLAGPAGLAAGLFLATAGVGLLASELLGLTDVTPVVEAETDSMEGAFADMAFLVGGPLVGFISAGFSLLTGDFEGAKNKFINTSVEWAKAAARWSARVQLGFAAFGQAVKTGIRATVEALDFIIRSGLNSVLGFINTWTERTRDAIVGGLNSAVASAIGPLNELIAKVNQIPRVDIDPIGSDFQLAQTAGRQTGRISTIQNEGLDSRLARVRRQGRRNLEGARRRTERQLERFAPDTIGGDRQTRGIRRRRPSAGGVPAGGSRGPQTQNITVEIGDQSLDLSDLSRGDQRRLAELIGDELGANTQNIAGGR